MTSVVARFNAPICKYHVDIMYPQFSISDFDAVALAVVAIDFAFSGIYAKFAFSNMFHPKYT